MKTPADFPKLNLPACRLRVAERGGEMCVWDALRGRWLVLTPEEWVRRHVLAFLSDGVGGAGGLGGAKIPAARISQEHGVDVNGAHQRADVVVFDTGGKPLLVVECKAPEVKIDEAALAQAFRYNAVLGARYVMLTNGAEHYIYEVAGGEYTPLKDFPKL